MTSDFGYQLLSKVDEGPAGTAWRARARASGIHALVRVFQGSRWDEESARGAFQARAEVLGHVEHPYLARQLQAGCLPDGRPYVVSEYLDGEDLAAHIRRSGPLTPEELSLLVLPLCSVLSELRSRGVVVAALPLEQIFLVGGLSRFTPKLIGPGLSDAAGEPEAGADVAALGRLMRAAGTPSLGWLEPVVAGCEGKGGLDPFPTPAEVARALLEAQPRTELLPTKDGVVQPPLLLVDEADREKVGDVLGQYRLERLLGEGAMGRVFEARHVSLGRPAAVKVLRAEHARNTHLIQRFFHEARAVNQINHAHIVEILDFVEESAGPDRPRVYCVMEMLEGRSLTELLLREHPTLSRAQGIVRQVCSALQAAHDVGVIHRDVKPDNLFVLERDGGDFVKVLDFGVAKLVNPLGELPLTTTVEGTIVGTPAYMAPEQATGGNADARTDLYAIGVVLYELLAGHPPFQAPAFGQLVAQVLSAPPPPLPSHTPGGERIPAALTAVVRRCLAKDPADRFDSMRELSEAIDEAQRKAGRPSRVHPWLFAAGVGVVAVALAAAGGLWRWYGPVAKAPPPGPTPASVAVVPSAPPSPQLPPLTAEVGLTVESTPAGARVVELASGRVLGTTPLTTRVERSSEKIRLRLERSGHRPTVVSVMPNTDRQITVALSRRRGSGASVSTGAKRTERRDAKHADPFKL